MRQYILAQLLLIVIGVGKLTIAKLQDTSTFRKVIFLDNHVMCAFAGLHADARVLVQRLKSNANLIV
jgi:20S proteasome alpha/beta subunit